MQIFDKPILRGDRARRRRSPVLVEIHQDDRVAFFAEEFVIVGVVARGQLDHQLQADGVQRGAKLGDEFAKIGLRLGREWTRNRRRCRTWCASTAYSTTSRTRPWRAVLIREHLHHFVDAPDLAVVVVEQAHDRQFDVGGFHPAMELVVFEQRDRFFGRAFTV